MNQDHSIHSRAEILGFDRCGIARCRPLEERRGLLERWLAQGRHGGLTYMERNLDKRIDRPAGRRSRSVVVCAISYNRPPAAGVASRIASYARGRDYHPVLKEKLHELLAYIRDLHPGTSGRVFVDTAPILEKSWAAEAGVGRIGRHSLLIVPGLGSFVVLGLIVTDAELEPDPPFLAPDPCGSCRACIEACPVGAIGNDRTIDASLCISRRTIEAEAGDEGDLHGVDIRLRHLPAGLPPQPPCTGIRPYLLRPGRRYRTDDRNRLAAALRNRFPKPFRRHAAGPLRTGAHPTPHPARFTKITSRKNLEKTDLSAKDISLQRFSIPIVKSMPSLKS